MGRSVKVLVKGGLREACGEVVKVDRPISLLGDIDVELGAVKGVERTFIGRILVLPHLIGSTVGPYVLYGLSQMGKAPRAIVLGKADILAITASVLARVPLVEAPTGMFIDGKEYCIDLASGYVEAEP